MTSLTETISRACCTAAIAIACAGVIPQARAHNATDDQPEVAAALQRIRDKVSEISRGRTEEQVVQEIDAWKKREPTSAQPYVVLANYYLQKTVRPTQVNIRTDIRPGEQGAKKGDLALVDKKTGKKVGVIEEEPVGQPASPEKVQAWRTTAADELAKALKVAPNRFDIMIGRAMVLGDLQQWKPMDEQLEMALQRAAGDPQNLRWLEDKPTPRNPRDEIIESVQGKILVAFHQENAEGDARANELATLGLKYFPNSVEFLTDIGNVHLFSEDFKGAISYYERAATVAPNDSIVLNNLSRVYLRSGDHEKARAFAQKVIELNNDPQSVEHARELLKETAPKRGRH